jgi:cytochrome c oxidase subunit 2
MLIGISLVLIVVGSLAFHFLSPWTFTELASNWGAIDTALWVTMIVTTVVFVVINLFVAYTVIKFRYHKDRKAKFEPENKKLEWVLITITSIGIVMLLAPSLFVYSDIVSPPDDAMTVEALAQQWSWSFRFPGEDGVLGRSSTELINFDNPFGLDPEDPHSDDDVLIENPNNELHFPVDQPIKMVLRSKDVLHDFYVPNFRVKMDLVPGIITSIWFTPNKTGSYNLVCAEYCGTGHWAMGGDVIVESKDTFDTWLAGHPTFKRPDDAPELTPVEIGATLAQRNGCLGCHSVDGSAKAGPTWLNLYGKQETLNDGSTVTVDDDYLKESVLDPGAKIVSGFSDGLMQPYNLDDEQLNALIEYIKTLN